VVTAIVPVGPAPVYSSFLGLGRASVLTADEIGGLERCLRLSRRRVLSDGEVVRRLGAVARPHNLDAILADLPPELIEPLRSQTRAYRLVRAIGYWCPAGPPPSRPSFRRPSGAAFPDPRRLVCSGRYPVDRGAVARYLRDGREYARWRGPSYCRFGCGIDNSSMGSRCPTDGAWVWPEGLFHDVEAHSVLLPEEFARMAEAIGGSPLRDREMPGYDTQGEPDYDFWVNWGRSAMKPVC
jgi:hypothetical protein